jgi:hypothetical protein
LQILPWIPFFFLQFHYDRRTAPDDVEGGHSTRRLSEKMFDLDTWRTCCIAEGLNPENIYFKGTDEHARILARYRVVKSPHIAYFERTLMPAVPSVARPATPMDAANALAIYPIQLQASAIPNKDEIIPVRF